MISISRRNTRVKSTFVLRSFFLEEHLRFRLLIPIGIAINERKYYTFAHRYCEMKGCGIMSLSPTMLETVYDVGSDVNRLLRDNPRFAGCTSDLGRSIAYLRYLVEGAEGQ